MPMFKVGDKVEIVGTASDGSDRWVGQRGHIHLELESLPPLYRVEYAPGRSMTFWAASLRPLPVFKAGDRVLVIHTGKEEPILRVWHSEGVADVYELEDEFCDADELEIAPKREPKAGEVWSCRGVSVAILTDTGGFLRSVNLETNRLYAADPLEIKHLLDLGFTFAAASLKDAAALGLL